MTSLFRSLCMSLSFGVLAYAQSGESMGTAYPVPIFSNAPTIVGNLRVWEWHTYDSTRQRVNNHNLSTGADVVWKLVLPSCLDSLEVHFCPVILEASHQGISCLS
ncbi:MAG: hypothetical protein N2170_09910 [Bacteroidia bacterium]|nr:hypothetical protein [Bacteroidia bacterium]